MKAALYTETGAAEVIHLVDRPLADPGPGEVRVRMHRSGVNPTDWKAREGSQPGQPVDAAAGAEPRRRGRRRRRRARRRGRAARPAGLDLGGGLPATAGYGAGVRARPGPAGRAAPGHRELRPRGGAGRAVRHGAPLPDRDRGGAAPAGSGHDVRPGRAGRRRRGSRWQCSDPARSLVGRHGDRDGQQPGQGPARGGGRRGPRHRLPAAGRRRRGPQDQRRAASTRSSRSTPPPTRASTPR